MQLKTFVAQDAEGNVIAEALVYLYHRGTNTLAAGLQSVTGAALLNPLSTSADGDVTFAAPDGDYDLRVTGAGRDRTRPVQFLDTREQVALAQAAATLVEAKAAEVNGVLQVVNAAVSGMELVDQAVTDAQNAASVAQGHAASASSVVQQDLSGVTAAALHRSPNAVTALFVYDTSKDSDGGAWTEKCQHTSWYNEPLSGKWLGALATEAAARAVAGAVTGDYFQRTSDGRFYGLNAGSGITEVFRGNKRDFPRLSAMVAEGGSVTIYDLTEPGRPMWMRFAAPSSTTGVLHWANTAAPTVASVSALGGNLVIAGSSETRLIVVNYAKDDIRLGSSGFGFALSNASRQIAGRNGATAYINAGDGYIIAASTINAVAMTVLPGAPIDPATGLQVPTIAVATAGGISLISHTGQVSSSMPLGWPDLLIRVAFVGDQLVRFGGGDGWYNYLESISARAESVTGWARFGPVSMTGGAGSSSYGILLFGAQAAKNAFATSAGVVLVKPRPSRPAAGCEARLNSFFNAGYLVGDIRRAYLAEVGAGAVTGGELLTNGGFDSAESWTVGANWGISGGSATHTAGAGGDLGQAIDTVPGRPYLIKFSVTSAAGTMRFNLSGGTSRYYEGLSGTYSVVLVAGDAPGKLTIEGDGNFVGAFESVSVFACVVDRSYKDASATITGTLTKTPVATGAQLIAYSGFSAANYMREPYHADLDFGTGEWSASAWVNFATAVASTIASREAASGAYIRLGTTSTGQLTATAFNGTTTTRTVTTAATYNTGTWLKARVNYRAGRLSILVNGLEVAVTNGAPLLTLNNSNAVLTIGNSFALDAPFPGSIALLKFSATVPTAEQALWMYEQEKHMFRDGAQVTLPDAGAIVDMAYDDATDKWIAVSATNESEWSGLVRTSVTPAPAGSYSRVAASSGIQLLARTTTQPGVDVTIPAYGLREELVKRGEAAARLSKDVAVFDFDTVSFTGAMTSGSNQVTASSITGTPYIGMAVTGNGLPAGTTIGNINGTTYTLSANATATGSNTVGQAGFDLPTGYTARVVYSAGTQRREGATRDYTRQFDGFRERVLFGVTPGASAWVQVHATKEQQ